MRRSRICFGVLLLLSACAAPEQNAEKVAAFINENYGQACEKLGYTAGTDKHRDCMVSMCQAAETFQ